MWKVRAKTVPLTVGTLGTVKKELYQNLHLLPGHPSTMELQKSALMTTAHMIS